MAGGLLTIVGARPQFVKASVVSRELRRRDRVREAVVHTGQHFDHGMSEIFFDELGMDRPVSNLGVSGGSHAEMTGRMLVAIEKELIERSPDAVLLYGDTNSTLAGALASAKLNVPVIHVEAGVRSRSGTSPEEVNRVCTDHVASLLLACTESSMTNLEAEGLGGRSRLVGDSMYDAFLAYGAQARRPVLQGILDRSVLDVPPAFYYATCHREENTADGGTLESLVRALAKLDLPVVWPVHPRVASRVAELAAIIMPPRLGSLPYDGDGPHASRPSSRADGQGLLLCKPVGYLESMWLVSHAEQVITDSGGLQREAFFAKVKCTTLLDDAVWPETMVGNRNVLAKPDPASIAAAMALEQTIDSGYMPFGDGHSAVRIADSLEEFLERGGRL